MSVHSEDQVRADGSVVSPGQDGKMIRYPGYGILFAAWTLMGSLSYLHHRLLPGAPPENVLFGLSGWLGCYYAWIPLTPIVFLLERRFPVARPFSLRNAAILILCGLPFCYVAFQISIVFSRTVHLVFWNRAGIERFMWRIPTSEIALQFFVYAVTVVASAFIRFLIESQQKEREAALLALEKSRLESALRSAELETLRMRLNPHFLFNCLQNISSLAGQDAKAASQMLARLGDLLRVALRSDYKDRIPLSDEVALTRAYISIEQVRHGNRLSVLFDIAPETERVLVPNLLLQPLVENAIKHGISGRAGAIWVQSAFEKHDRSSDLVLTIRDNGAGLPVRNPAELRLGVGLGATKERLMRMYDRQSLDIKPLPEGGTEVRVVLPADDSPRAAEAVTLAAENVADRAPAHQG